jgi:hypothetical protein
MKKYFDVISESNDKLYCYYLLSINWIPKNIINDHCNDGYIVQKVNLTNDTGIKEIKNISYYEAWQVQDKKVIKNNHELSDDTYRYLNINNIDEILKDSLGKVGNISYEAEVYWVSKNNILYDEINSWKYGDVVEAGSLKSILASKCSSFDNISPLFVRDKFIHKVSFKDYDTVRDNFIDIYKDRIIKKDTKLKKELYKILKNTDYSNIIKDICNW